MAENYAYFCEKKKKNKSALQKYLKSEEMTIITDYFKKFESYGKASLLDDKISELINLSGEIFG